MRLNRLSRFRGLGFGASSWDLGFGILGVKGIES